MNPFRITYRMRPRAIDRVGKAFGLLVALFSFPLIAMGIASLFGWRAP